MAVMMVERMAVKMVLKWDFELGATMEKRQALLLVVLKGFWLVVL